MGFVSRSEPTPVVTRGEGVDISVVGGTESSWKATGPAQININQTMTGIEDQTLVEAINSESALRAVKLLLLFTPQQPTRPDQVNTEQMRFLTKPLYREQRQQSIEQLLPKPAHEKQVEE